MIIMHNLTCTLFHHHKIYFFFFQQIILYICVFQSKICTEKKEIWLTYMDLTHKILHDEVKT